MNKENVSIQSKINSRLQPLDALDIGNTTMIYKNGFHNQAQLSNYLCEGSLLNITKIASKALSVPAGEYMVWVTDVGHTMLIPTINKINKEEVFENISQEYDVLTPLLLKNWHSIEKVVLEDQNSDTQFQADKSSIKRKAMYQAMVNNGYGEDYSGLAAKVGVQTPMISRILSGDRTPSMGTASQICKALSSDPTAIFPDIFDVKSAKHVPKKVKGNKASGKGNLSGSTKKGKAAQKWTQGGSKNESKIRQDVVVETDMNTSINNDVDDIEAAVNNVQTSTDNQKDSQNDQLKKQLDPQLRKVETDIEELEEIVDQSQANADNNYDNIKNMENQLNNINAMINKIASQI